MGVIAVNLGSGEIAAFVKGSPEVIKDLCIPSSLPADYECAASALTSVFVITAAAFARANCPVLRLQHADVQVRSARLSHHRCGHSQFPVVPRGFQRGSRL